MAFKKKILIDFDGVIHSYKSGWTSMDVVSDPPVEGAFDAIRNYLRVGYEVAIYSTRSATAEGLAAMKYFFRSHGWLEDSLGEPAMITFPTEKPAAWLTIDDRCICFNGTFPTVEEIDAFKPWYKKEKNVLEYIEDKYKPNVKQMQLLRMIFDDENLHVRYKPK